MYMPIFPNFIHVNNSDVRSKSIISLIYLHVVVIFTVDSTGLKIVPTFCIYNTSHYRIKDGLI
jgi:hypothetical protein